MCCLSVSVELKNEACRSFFAWNILTFIQHQINQKIIHCVCCSNSQSLSILAFQIFVHEMYGKTSAQFLCDLRFHFQFFSLRFSQHLRSSLISCIINIHKRSWSRDEEEGKLFFSISQFAQLLCYSSTLLRWW